MALKIVNQDKTVSTVAANSINVTKENNFTLLPDYDKSTTLSFNDEGEYLATENCYLHGFYAYIGATTEEVILTLNGDILAATKSNDYATSVTIPLNKGDVLKTNTNVTVQYTNQLYIAPYKKVSIPSTVKTVIGMPDYSTTSDLLFTSNTWVAPYDCYVYGVVQSTGNSGFTIYVNNNAISTALVQESNFEWRSNLSNLLRQGDILTISDSTYLQENLLKFCKVTNDGSADLIQDLALTNLVADGVRITSKIEIPTPVNSSDAVTKNYANFSHKMFTAEGSYYIDENEDLNDLKFLTVGDYSCSTNVRTLTLSNCPSPKAFRLTVCNMLTSEKSISTEGYLYFKQELENYEGDTWERHIATTNNGTITIPEWTRTRNNIPVGTIIDSLEENIEGYLRLEGQTLQKDEYPALSEMYSSIGYPNGSSDTTFNLIDARNRVSRGLGDLTAEIGKSQEDAMQPMTGSFESLQPGGSTSGIFYNSGSRVINQYGGSGEYAYTSRILDSNRQTRTADETRVKSFTTYKHQKY